MSSVLAACAMAAVAYRKAANTNTSVDGSTAGQSSVQDVIVFAPLLDGTVNFNPALGSLIITDSVKIVGHGADPDIGFAGRRNVLARNDFVALDPAQLGFDGVGYFEGAPADMLTFSCQRRLPLVWLSHRSRRC